MIRYPQHYAVRAHSEAGMRSLWKSGVDAGTSPSHLDCAIPPEFDGPGGGLSPEDLYALALLNCFVATFKVFAQKSRITFRGLEARGELTVDRGEDGVPWMAAFHLVVEVTLGEAGPDPAGARERLLGLLEKTSRSCLIHQSVRTKVTFEWRVT